MPSRIESPGIWWVELPCQVIVQPPAWSPMLSALLPATYTCSAFFFSGRVRSSFLSSTCDFATASRATARCALLPIESMLLRSV